MGSHNDWVLDTVFSADGSHLISVGRDMTAKLTEVATQRFVDNITSITPGALKGGIAGGRPASRSATRSSSAAPTATPKVYRVFRQTARVIGDDSNLIREFPPMPGRIYSVAVSADGKRIAAGSSLDGAGEVGVYALRVRHRRCPTTSRRSWRRSPTPAAAEERPTLDKYHKDGRQADRAGSTVPRRGVYAVAVPARRQGRWRPPAPTAWSG